MKAIFRIITLLCFLCSGTLQAQFTDNFSDGNFTANPIWTGQTAQYIVNPSFQLRSNGLAATDTITLSTPSTVINNAEWQFWFQLNFAPSASNFVQIYLVSDQQDLTGPLNGYYIKVGENLTGDGLDLYKQTGLTSTLVIGGLNGTMATSGSQARVRVRRDAAGNWTMWADHAGGFAWVQEGSTVNDVSFTTTNYSGVYCRHTSTNTTTYLFDDFYAGPYVIDVTPPTLTSATAISSTAVDVSFSEPVGLTSAQTAANYSANNGLGTPTSAVRDGADFSLVHLTFGTSLGNAVNYTLTVNSVADTAGNVMSGPGTDDFMWFVPDVPQARDVIINEIFADPDTAATNMPIGEFVEIYNRSPRIFDLAGWKFRDAATTVTLSSHVLFPGDYLILCKSGDTAAYNAFGTTLVVSLPALNNAGDQLGLRSPANLLIDSVAYDISWYQDAIKDDGGWSLELINPDDTCNVVSNWIASNDPDGGTPGTQNSVFSNSPDVTPPQFVSLVITSPNTIQVCFDESMDAALFGDVTNYSIDHGMGNPVAASVIAPGNTCVDLTLSSAILDDTLYTITFTGLADCPGNVAPTFSQTFLQAGPASVHDVLINEIYADPDSAATNMPGGEFIELYNASTRTFDLAGWTFSDATSPVTLGNYLLAPGQYVVLAKAADTAALSLFGPVIAVSLPSLNNGGDQLGLRSSDGTLIDSVEYDISWYQDATKDDGGWTLERINPFDTCSFTGNWIASNDPDGGTPGTQNSVFSASPDVTPPQFVSLTITGASTLQVCFDETMDAGLLADPTNYAIDHGMGNPLTAVPQSPANSCVDLNLATPIVDDTLYTITFTNLADCKGNVAPAFSETFLQSSPALPLDVLINEIYPDPDSMLTNMPGGEFIELFNRSVKTYNLAGWTFSDASSTATLGNVLLPAGGYLILCKAADTASLSSFGNVLPISLPSLNNSGDFLGLRSVEGALIDTVEYDISWYQDDTKDDGGFTLERINPFDTCSYFGNWIASNDPDGGTPGEQNSVFNASPDVMPPQFVSLTITSLNTIQVCFDETMDAGLLNNVTSYSIDNGMGTPVAAAGLAPGNACVDLTLALPIDTGTVYTITFTGLADCKGNMASSFTETFVLGAAPAPFQVVINEIFPDPSPVIGLPAQEFVELHNASANVIDLNGLIFTDGTSDAVLPQYALMPGEFVILTATANVSLYTPFGNVIGLSGFPSLNNAEDSLVLTTAGGTSIDEVQYTDAWYHDDAKADGGWTLERIDASFICQNEFNWNASTNPGGGTPGTANSVAAAFTDVTAPEADRAFATDPSLVRLYFNEIMNAASLSDPQAYTIDNGIGNPILAAPVGNHPLAVDLLLPAPLDSNQIYCVTVTGVTDCPGNVIGSANSVCFGIPLPAGPGDVILNEILFNPYTGGSDYVELYNLSDKIIDLSSLLIGEIFEGTDSVYNTNPAADETWLLMPGQYVAVTPDKSFQVNTYLPINPDAILEVSSLSSFDDTEGECVVLRSDGTVLDRFFYLDDYHFPNLDDKEGVSLERLSFTASSSDPGNWHSAASTVHYGTPGYENSQLFNGGDGSGNVWLTPETFSPDNDGVDDILFIHYLFPDPGLNAKVVLFDSRGRFVRTVQENILIGTDEGFFSWDGTDARGHKVDVGVYVLLFEATRPADGKTYRYKLGTVVAARF